MRDAKYWQIFCVQVTDSSSISLKNKISVLNLSLSINFPLFDLPAAKKITNALLNNLKKKTVAEKTTVATIPTTLCMFSDWTY